jgi:hypothetical protein
VHPQADPQQHFIGDGLWNILDGDGAPVRDLPAEGRLAGVE